jgi:hypothetical protein
MMYMSARSVNGSLETFRWAEQNRGPGDSAQYASALYHAAAAQGVYAGRWGLTGYMTMGTVATVFGAGLALSALFRWQR